MKVTPTEIAQYLQILAATPQRIASASAGRTDAELHVGSDEKRWSANEILAHLRACMDVWGKDIRRMLTEETPRWRYLSPRTWMRKTDYAEQPFQESLAVFVTEREELLALLADLPLEDWSRAAIVNQNGKERQQTVFTRVRQMAMHEVGHCEQIEELLKGEN